MRRIKAFSNRKDAAIGGKFFAELFAKGKTATVERYGGESQNTTGGFLAPIEVSKAIAETRDKVGVFRNLANVIDMASDNTIVPKRSGALAGYYVDENAQVTESQTGWDQVSLVTKRSPQLSGPRA
jgi:HK97 family phage major capsid protein